MKLFDVAIIGASISGASLGACLGVEAIEVALIDKERFPRRKACGEGLSNIAVDALQRMDLDVEDVLGSGIPYFDYRIEVGDRGLPFGSGQNRSLKGVGVERYHLDARLVELASSQPAVTPFFESTISAIRPLEVGYAVQFSDGAEIGSRFLVLSDGASSFSANILGIPKSRRDPPLWGISFVMAGSFLKDPEEVVVLLREGFEINCTPVSDSRLNVTFLASREQVKALQSEEVRSKLLTEASARCDFFGSPVEPPLAVGPVSSTRRPFYRDSILLLGDAAETLDPVAGMGMTHGILMAEIAADTLLATLRDGVDPESALHRYAKRSEAMSRPIRGFTRLTASLLRSPARSILLPTLASTNLPGMIRSALDNSLDSTAGATSLSGKFLSLVGA